MITWTVRPAQTPTGFDTKIDIRARQGPNVNALPNKVGEPLFRAPLMTGLQCLRKSCIRAKVNHSFLDEKMISYNNLNYGVCGENRPKILK